MTRLRAREIYNVPALRLIAVESVRCWSNKADYGCQIAGGIETLALIVCGPAGAYALDMDAAPADLGQLKDEIPGLEKIIRRQ